MDHSPTTTDNVKPSTPPQAQSLSQPQQQPPARRRSSSCSRRNSDFQNSLVSLPEVEALVEGGGAGSVQSSRRSSISSGSGADAAVASGSGQAVPQQGATAAASPCNSYGRRAPRRSSRYRNNFSNGTNGTDQDYYESVDAAVDQHEANNENGTTSMKRESWKITDWEEMPGYNSFNSSYNSFNASQSSMYHKLEELLEEGDCEDWNEDYQGSNDHSSSSCNRRSLHDILFEEPLGDNAIFRSKGMDGSDQSSMSVRPIAPKRGMSRQTSAKSFRRSVQDTLRKDEDTTSIFGNSCATNLTSSMTSEGELEHAFGDLVLDGSNR